METVRRHQRNPENELVKIVSQDGTGYGKVTDFSISGASIELRSLLTHKVGDKINILYMGGWMAAEVRRVATSKKGRPQLGILWSTADQSDDADDLTPELVHHS